MIIRGTEFKKEAAIIHSMKDDLPQIGQIVNIYIVEGNIVLFECECFTTTYNPHFRTYALRPLNLHANYFYHKLLFQHPLHIRSPRVSPSTSIVILPYNLLAM